MGTDDLRVTAQPLRMLAALPETWSPVPAPAFSYCQKSVTLASGIQIQGLLIFSNPCTHVHNPTHPQTFPRNFFYFFFHIIFKKKRNLVLTSPHKRPPKHTEAQENRCRPAGQAGHKPKNVHTFLLSDTTNGWRRVWTRPLGF